MYYSFLIFYYILDECWQLCHEDDLGGFLGAISPELLTTRMPIDMVYYYDWADYNKGYIIDNRDSLNRIYDFLDKNEKELGFHFQETKKVLLSDITDQMIKAAIENARQMEELKRAEDAKRAEQGTREISGAIKRIYFERDFAGVGAAVESCRKVTDWIDGTLHDSGKQYIVSDIADSPSAKIYVKLPLSGDDCEFFIDVRISKIAKCYLLSYGFSIKNPAPDKIEPVLDGFSAEPYTLEQAILAERIIRPLDSSGYLRLTDAQAAEVIPEIKMPENNFFGTQMTVETALFHDVWGIFQANDE